MADKKVNKNTVMMDKERTFKYPLYSLVRLQREHGIKLQDLQDKEKASDLGIILAIIWAGLVHEDKDLTYEDVGNMIDIADVEGITEVMVRAINGTEKK